MTPKIDPLRERLARAELRVARRIVAKEGASGLIENALREVEGAEALLAAVERARSAAEGDARAAVAAYLKETSAPRELAANLRWLDKGKGELFDISALAESVARQTAEKELLAEVSIALARKMLDTASAPSISLPAVLELAKKPGRWSRRTEALALLRDLVRYVDPRAIAALARTLTARDEHRWVQPEALATLDAANPEAAHRIALERMTSPGGGDDLLVRERIVHYAGRARRKAWADVLVRALRDPSDHVRLTAARLQRDPATTAKVVREDESPKVRAAGLVALTRRPSLHTEPALFDALVRDRSPLVVRVAASQLAWLARKRLLKNRRVALDSLRKASVRSELTPDARARAAEDLAEVSVLVDPLLGVFHRLMRDIVAKTPVEGAMRVAGPWLDAVDDMRLGRVLEVLARNDFAHGADRVRGGIMLYRGEPRTLAPWRLLYELFHPVPSKRQGYVHSWARSPRGRLRAPPGGLAEVTATAVPGERVVVGSSGDWGRHVPLVDDLLSAGALRRHPLAIVGPLGTTYVESSADLVQRVRGWLALTTKYAHYTDLRRRALESDEAGTQSAFADRVEREAGIVIRFVPHRFARGLALPPPPPLASRSSASLDDETKTQTLKAGSLLALVPLEGVLRDFVQYSTQMQGNRLPHVAAFASLLLTTWLARAVLVKRSIDADRRAIPLVVGGWGTRGKSGTERLKAGLFQGLGYETLVKTTGCEAMFIHAMPGVPAREVFIYRPYDKATIWEQRDLLHLGRRFGVRVFLWECMALQPDLVNLLQSQWMRDDYSTITNAYPDHEDVQGPTGYDVAEVISEFCPMKGHLFTSEDQMLPLMRERAKKRGTSLRVVSWLESDLLSDDLLARFPYHEHPRNIALVARLASTLGIPAPIAIAEMADNVVPDLGVLKSYPKIAHEGRTLDFTNGMSANERTGAIGNWRRMKFDEHDPDTDPKRWIVTVVNNRGDRIARSEVFARFIVEDVAAHRHFLIGTNVSGLVNFIGEALDKHLEALSPTSELVGSATERLATAKTRIEKAFLKLMIKSLDAASVVRELEALGLAALDERAVEALLVPASAEETHAAAKSAVGSGISTGQSSMGEDASAFVASIIARRRTARAVLMATEQFLANDSARVDRVFGAAYRAMFEENVVALHDSGVKGDAIIDRIARAIPPGAHGSIMGLQNIKGTGLDFVYRWVSIDFVDRALTKLTSGSPAARTQALRELTMHDDYGLYDARQALEVVTAARERAPVEEVSAYDGVIARLRTIVEAKAKALDAMAADTFGDKVRKVIGKTFDYLDSVNRQRMARTTVEHLIAGRISHATAAVKMRDVVARAKGAWMQRRR